MTHVLKINRRQKYSVKRVSHGYKNQWRR